MRNRNIIVKDTNGCILLPKHKIERIKYCACRNTCTCDGTPRRDCDILVTVNTNYCDERSSSSIRNHHRPRSCSPIRNTYHHPVSKRICDTGSQKNLNTDDMCRGEKICYKVLRKIEGVTDIVYKYRIDSYDKKSYDFGFVYENKRYLLEWDGQSHFIDEDCYEIRKNIHDRQFRDIMYTNTALLKGYKIIRIDYTQIECIRYHIEKALKEKRRYYFSDDCMYEYIIRAIIAGKH